MINLYHEIFDKLTTLDSREQKIAWLQANSTPRFKDFLICMFDPNIHFDVKIPEYRPAVEPAGLNFSTLHTEMGRIYLFVTGHPKCPSGVTPDKKESILKSILESIHKREAELFVALLTKKLKVKSLTPKLVKEAFPDINVE